MRTSLRPPIALGVIMIVLVVALIPVWVLVTVKETDKSGVYWVWLALGTTFLVMLLVGVVLYLLISVKGIRLNQRQSNFIDSVTHELKSPIASLKLYLQTLSRRNVDEQRQADFYRFMLDDVERLDSLINHLLDAARLDQQPVEAESDVELAEVLRSCASTACLRYRLSPEIVQLSVEPALVRARPMDLEMIFRNLIDNAIKYADREPQVEIESHAKGDHAVVTRIIDNGRGIPQQLRRKIFGRFVRLGNELERSRTGTGLGLFIVRNLVKRLGGQITVRDRLGQPGTIFEVQLPSRPISAVLPPCDG
jgi:signal transduction histidine kinase